MMRERSSTCGSGGGGEDSDRKQLEDGGAGSNRGSRRASVGSHEDDDSVTEDDEEETEGEAALPSSHQSLSTDEAMKRRRAKRLAMNRESARARRKRKKMLLETLEKQVAELSGKNQSYHAANEALLSRVKQLERELATARSTIALLTSSTSQQPSIPAVSRKNLPTAGTASALTHQGLPLLGSLGASPQAAISLDDSGSDPLRRLLQAKQGNNPLPEPQQGIAGNNLAAMSNLEQILREKSVVREQQQRLLELQQSLSHATRESAAANLLDRLHASGNIHQAPGAASGLQCPLVADPRLMPAAAAASEDPRQASRGVHDVLRVSLNTPIVAPERYQDIRLPSAAAGLPEAQMPPGSQQMHPEQQLQAADRARSMLMIQELLKRNNDQGQQAQQRDPSSRPPFASGA